MVADGVKDTACLFTYSVRCRSIIARHADKTCMRELGDYYYSTIKVAPQCCPADELGRPVERP